MLLPDNIHPEHSIYYNGALVLKKLKDKSNQNMIELYQCLKEENSMSFSVFVLSLDWLFLIDLAQVDEEGCVGICI
jgi:hypothetical protein